MRLRLRRPSVLLLAAALAALAIAGTAGAKSFTPAAGGRLGAGGEGRQPARRRAHHLRLQRAVQRRLSRHPAPHGRDDRSGPRHRERPRLPPGRVHRARLHRRRRHVRNDQGGPLAPRRLALRRRRRAPHLHGALPHERPRGRLRRRRRRQPQGVGLRVGRAARPADGDRGRARQGARSLGPPRLRARRRAAPRHEGAAAGARRPRRPVRRAPHGDPTEGVQLDGRDARRRGQRPGEDRRAQETADAAAFEKDQERIDHAKAHPLRYALYLLLLGTIPAFLIVGGVFWFYGRERKTGYDREYEQEPPTETDAGARADAAAAGRRGGLVRVHRDPLRPDPPRRLHLDAGHDRAQDLGRPAERERLGSRARPRARRTRS